ncbi:MAG: tetratricopeptide repeat protein [Gallionellaceae bacterium]|nr:tetratricopeptide repeat protein [Gallionellaceae bacterium]
MDIANRFSLRAALCASALLLGFSLNARADEIQDINKLFKQKDYTQALERVDAYLVSKPKDAQARFLKGLILTEQGQTTEAISLFSALTEEYPELPEPYNNLAVLYASQGQYDKARIALEMAIRTHPSYATAHENLGDIYAKMASQAYDRALQLDKGNTATKTKLALIKDLFTGTAKAGKAGTAVAAGAAATKSKSTTAAAPIPVAVSVPVASATSEVASAVPVTTVAAAPVEQPASTANAEALKTVQDWAAAWSTKDVAKYLAFYAADFKTPGGESRKDWEAARSERISKPKSIRVSISKAKVKITDDSHATVTFRQSYRSNQLSTSSTKSLALVKTDGKWLIQEERSGK